MATASARHILVKNEEECKELKEKINRDRWFQSLTGLFLMMRSEWFTDRFGPSLDIIY